MCVCVLQQSQKFNGRDVPNKPINFTFDSRVSLVERTEPLSSHLPASFSSGLYSTLCESEGCFEGPPAPAAARAQRHKARSRVLAELFRRYLTGRSKLW